MKYSALVTALLCATSLALAACATAPRGPSPGHAARAQSAAGNQHGEGGHCAQMGKMHQARGGKGMASCPMHAGNSEQQSSENAETSAPEQHKH